jgi:hypothetical protein
MSEEKEKIAEDSVNILIGRLKKHPETLKGWGKAFRIGFEDIGMGWWIKIAMDGSIEKVESGPWKKIKTKEAVSSLITTADTLAGVLAGEINSQSAAASGAVKVEGSYEGIMKIAPAMGSKE